MTTLSPTRKRRDTLLLSLCVVLLAVGWGLSQPSAGLTPGSVAPGVSAPLIANGKGQVELARSPDGRATVLEFFASWCRNCASSVPKLEMSAAAENARFISVSVDKSREQGRAAALRWRLQRKVAFDETGAAARTFGVSVLPTVVVLGPEGTVIANRAGALSAATLDALVRSAVSDKAASRARLHRWQSWHVGQMNPVHLLSKSTRPQDAGFLGQVAGLHDRSQARFAH